jgi:uncharacterized protein YecE (DUF72 family)
LPKASTLENWVGATPEGFLFACKAHMRITHLLRLRESEFTELFFRAIDPLRATRRLGPVLFQLPPNFKADLPLLAAFLEKLPGDIRYAFEFRNKTWLTDDVNGLLEKHRIAVGNIRSAGSHHCELRLCPLAQRRLFGGGASRDRIASPTPARRWPRRVRLLQARGHAGRSGVCGGVGEGDGVKMPAKELLPAASSTTLEL